MYVCSSHTILKKLWILWWKGLKVLSNAQFSSDQSCRSVVSFRRSIVSDSATPWTAAWQVPLSITNSEFSQTHVHRVSDAIHHLTLCRPLLFLPSIFPGIRVFSNESALCIRWTKYWSFSFSISPSSEYSKLISFRIDWFNLLAF